MYTYIYMYLSLSLYIYIFKNTQFPSDPEAFTPPRAALPRSETGAENNRGAVLPLPSRPAPHDSAPTPPPGPLPLPHAARQCAPHCCHRVSRSQSCPPKRWLPCTLSNNPSGPRNYGVVAAPPTPPKDQQSDAAGIPSPSPEASLRAHATPRQFPGSLETC